MKMKLFCGGDHHRSQIVLRFGRISTVQSTTHCGFTLIEVLVVVAIVGILGAIAAPNWLGFQRNQSLIAGQDQVLQAMRRAQIQALQSRQIRQVGFRELNNNVQWATYSTTTLPTQIVWQDLTPGVRIDLTETTLQNTSGVYRVEFDSQGHVTPPFGRLTLESNIGSGRKRCVFVSTLLGALRKAADQECE